MLMLRVVGTLRISFMIYTERGGASKPPPSAVPAYELPEAVKRKSGLRGPHMLCTHRSAAIFFDFRHSIPHYTPYQICI
jgi:hypothetical protein